MRIPGEQAREVDFLVLDADGVLTDGGIYVADGVEDEPFQLRRFDVKDGLGVYLLREAGIEAAIVSGRGSPALRERARELRIEEVHQVSPREKVEVVESMLEERGLGWEDAACLADDLADLGVLRRVGLPCAVADAVPEVVDAAKWQSESPGGHGAVRELAEELLRARGEWNELLQHYVRTGEAPDLDGPEAR